MFDAEGRPVAVVRAGRTLLRLPDDTVVERSPQPEPIGSCRRLTRTAGGVLLAGVHDGLRRHAGELLRAAEAEATWPLAITAADWVRRALSWNAGRLAADGERFLSIYGSAGMLPPDPLATVALQAAVGCPYDRCTFCDGYRGTPFRARTRAEFRDHLNAVRDWLGAALRGRRWLFLGEADVLAMPTCLLTERLADAAERFSVAPPAWSGGRLARWLEAHPDGFAGFTGFVDERSGACKGVDNLVRLRAAGLRRAYVPLETGHDGLHRALRKPGTVGDAVRTVATLHDAGIEVGVFVLVGAGGRELAAEHLRRTARVLKDMDLRRQDAVFLSPLRRPASRRGSAFEPATLTRPDLAAQAGRLTAAVRRPNGPRIDVYRVEEHSYRAD